MVIINIASAIIFVLLGMRDLRRGLDRLFGNKLVDWLQKMTRNRYQAFLAGIVAGVIAPSSSAIAMLSMQMLNQTALTAGRMLAVVLGANVGITVTVQLLAFRLQDFAGLFILIGGVGFLFLNRAIFRGIGQIFLGLGFIFLAMSMISGAGKLAMANNDLKLLFSIVEHYPWVVLAGTAFLTLALQSSTASIGLGIGLAQSGLLTPSILMPWILGANLGIGLTMMIAGWASVEGRRLALGSLSIKSFGALVVLAGGLPLASRLMTLLPGEIDRQAANFNTLFNLSLGLCALPLLSIVYRALSYLIESQPIEEQTEPSISLDPLLLQTPSLALNHAAREELRMLDELNLMLRTAWTMLWGKNVRLISKIEEHQDHINTIEAALKDYLTQISDENLSEEDIDWRFNLLDYAQELIIIATLLRRDLADAVIRQIQSSEDLSSEDKSQIENLYGKTLERLEKATALLMGRDERVAKKFIEEKEEISSYYRTVRKLRLERLKPGQSLETNVLDVLNCLRRVNSHLTALAYSMARANPGAGLIDRATIAADPDESWIAEPEEKIRQQSN
jgi:phosphate:Na+ symporter